MVVNPSVPAKTVSEFIACPKANLGRVNMGSAGIGSAGHLAGELFKMMADVSLVHEPYRGNAPALTNLIAGRVEVLFPSAASSIEYVKTGKVRGLAVTGAPHRPRRHAAAGIAGQFGKLIVDETEKWGKVIKFAGIKAQ
jgi:tripartite-type tricarboxylate transporter receptor subunit TctC